jgi:MoaA/NifB/PqqE/SkfB family radical SAM enzyme
LELAEKCGTSVQFQPATASLLGTGRENPGAPDPELFRQVIGRLIELKRGPYKRQIGNSIAGLKHLRKWPEPTHVKCISGLVTCRIEPDGRMYHCGRVIASTEAPPNVLDSGFRDAFEKLQPFFCTDCWCAQRVELALASDFNIQVIRNLIGLY